MNLEAILKEIEVQRGFQNADASPEVIHGRIPGTELARVAGLEIAKRQAGPQIEALRNAYDQIIYRTSVVIFVKGTAAARQAFLDLAAGDDALVVNGDAFYTDIVAGVEAQMSPQRIMNVGVGSEIVARIAVAMSRMAVNFEQYPKLPMEYVDSVLKTGAEVLQVVKAVALPCTHVPLAITWLERNIASMAFAKSFCSEPLPIVVSVEGDDTFTWLKSFMVGIPRVAIDVDDWKSPADALAKARETLLSQMQSGS